MNATAGVIRGPLSIPRMGATKMVFTWIGLALLAFPLAGYAGWGLGGHVDGVAPALIGGALTGAGIGFVQWLFLRRDLGITLAWIPATGVALAVGLAIGAAVVGYETGPIDLAIMGAICGLAVGFGQGILLRDRFSLWFAWMLAMPVMFAIGWIVSESIGVDVANQFTVFGASGSIVFGILSGLLMVAGKRVAVGKL
jgi:hypothetical protein